MSLSPIDLISSSSYPIPAQLDRGQRAAAHSNVLYGGLSLLPYDGTTTPTMTPTRTPTDDKSKTKKSTNKKSSHKSEDDNKVSKRKRGRPRVLDKDESAAERRRTQIRLAQRAYRSRKEATISSLSKRLSELDAAIRDMNTSVGNFRDELMGSGLLLQHSPLTYGLQKLVHKSDALVKLSAGNEEYESANTSPMDETVSNNSSSLEAGDALFVDQSPEITENLDKFNFPLYSSTDNTSSINFDSLFQGYELDAVQQPQQAPTTLTENANTQLVPSSFAEPFPQDLTNTNTNSSSWLQHNTIPPPSTYSFHESSFARRLRRQCAEYGYRVLTDPNSDPKDVIRIYRFSLCFKNKDALVDRFWKAITSSSPSSSSTTSATPAAAYTLGNAGIHYPRPQQPIPETTLSSPTELYPISKFIGPWAFHQAEAPHEFTSIDEIVSARGMAGDWFDSNDVEGYLREKGIQVDTQASFVTLPDDVPSPPLPSSSSSSSSSTQQLEYLKEGKQSPTAAGDELMIDPSLEAMTAPSTTTTTTTTTTTETQDSSKVVNTEINENTEQQSTRIFDVDMFLTQLIYKAVCLGEKAGYRKQDVEDCLRVACYAVA
ncbi:hypothetical protein DPV78_011359 [Talaromyces pinophilus]|nr:hypothetical protein DPV78_011359 [Talaromyces pinophilus]